IMVDPKRVELTIYNSIPHLLTPVITNVSKTINALKWCLNDMDQRFETLSKTHKRNIQAYNENLKPGQEKMPYIVFIIDELADLMVAAGRDIEGGVIRLAQMARAVGIHLVLATQRPSVDVITGLIKANMPTRIAFSVASGVDSKTILDSLGAEKLLGQGDMLFITAEISKPKRLQGAYVSDQEIKRIINYIRSKGGESDYVEGITEKQKVHGIAGVGLAGGGGDDEDELVEEAKELIINSGKASASFLQRRLSIGYARAARLLDILEENGIIGPSDGAKAREIMVSREQYEGLISQGVSGVSLHNKEEAEEPDEYLPDDDVETNGDSSQKNVETAGQLSDEETPDDTPENNNASKKNNSSDEEDDGMYFAK
ncbi:MAG: FtsK/SpoIIIE domain-containing protein, partial [Patescibacteria group bacterium]|nr:FtsK/SpoIIIE domain-containing protein [Patescibacteria group bacterium]